jgi:hypothetical protein
MRIHSDTLSNPDLVLALRRAGLQSEGVQLCINGTHGSRSHHRAVDVTLRAVVGRDRNGKARRPPMQGADIGADYPRAATYEEWGYFIAAVYCEDPDAKVGPYENVDDFDQKTRYAFDAPECAA